MHAVQIITRQLRVSNISCRSRVLHLLAPAGIVINLAVCNRGKGICLNLMQP